MTALARSLRVLSLTALAVSLSACISLFPKSDPSQLYRFDGAAPPAAGEAPAPSARFGVTRANGSFVQSAASDRILTVDGDQVAYIAESRWVSPAAVLFNEAMTRAFDANTGAARLMSRGERGRADYFMRVDVTRFEAVYDRGTKAAPEIAVTLRVALVRADRTLAGSTLIEANVRAADNRVSAIVAAFDQAVGQALGELIAWTNQTGATPA
jgi:cholesterol transport system auxiliary component